MFAAQTLALVAGCGAAERPPTRETITLSGSGYERGLQHGQKLRSKVRSFYTRLLESSILPNLNREQPGISQVFTRYAAAPYTDGNFSYQLLLDSAKELERGIPRVYRDEMHGIADGAGVPYDQVLITNTFLDSLLAIRAVSAAVSQGNAPSLTRVRIDAAGTDGIDNDGDGSVDEADEADFTYEASPVATRVELAKDAVFTFTLTDPDGVDPATVRIVFNGQPYSQDALSLQAVDAATTQVTFRPPGGLRDGANTLVVQCGDLSIKADPPPAHAHFMRDERLTVTARGTGLSMAQVPNRGSGDQRPPPFSFAATGGRTDDGAPLLAHQFALLDANVAHEHDVLFLNQLEDGHTVATVGWAGIVWGTSGMNDRGLAIACNPSDTLDNSVVKSVVAQIGDVANAKLTASGTPIGILERELLESSSTVPEALAQVNGVAQTFGWACALADGSGRLAALELDSNFESNGGVFTYGPADAPSFQHPDTLICGSHFQLNQNDMTPLTVRGAKVVPQRSFSTFFFRSVSTLANVDAALSALPKLSTSDAEAVLRTDGLYDATDSMNAVVYRPAARTLYVAFGEEPTPLAPFEAQLVGGGP